MTTQLQRGRGQHPIHHIGWQSEYQRQFEWRQAPIFAKKHEKLNKVQVVESEEYESAMISVPFSRENHGKTMLYEEDGAGEDRFETTSHSYGSTKSTPKIDSPASKHERLAKEKANGTVNQKYKTTNQGYGAIKPEFEDLGKGTRVERLEKSLSTPDYREYVDKNPIGTKLAIYGGSRDFTGTSRYETTSQAYGAGAARDYKVGQQDAYSRSYHTENQKYGSRLDYKSDFNHTLATDWMNDSYPDPTLESKISSSETYKENRDVKGRSSENEYGNAFDNGEAVSHQNANYFNSKGGKVSVKKHSNPEEFVAPEVPAVSKTHQNSVVYPSSYRNRKSGLLDKKPDMYRTEYQRNYLNWNKSLNVFGYSAFKNDSSMEKTGASQPSVKDDYSNKSLNLGLFKESHTMDESIQTETPKERFPKSVGFLDQENQNDFGAENPGSSVSSFNDKQTKKSQSRIPKLMRGQEQDERKDYEKQVFAPEEIGANTRILNYKVSPPPTWNLAQSLLQKARNRLGRN